jgi:hypothetical protein
VSYDEPQPQVPAFSGSSRENRAAALDQAAEKAQSFFKAQGREGVVLEVIREEVKISNPHISEFRIIIVESGGGGDGG